MMLKFSGVVFWSIYLTDPTLLAPASLFSYMPYWAQHLLHTVPLAVVVIDLLVTPRQRPSSLKIHLTLLSSFVLIYCAVVYRRLCRGEIVYAFLEHLSPVQLVQIILFSLLMHFIFFYVQWLVICRFSTYGKEKCRSNGLQSNTSDLNFV